MIMALITLLLMKLGIAPSVDDFARMDREFRERGHHVTLDFGGSRVGGWTRWTDDDWRKDALIGLGYEYYIDRRYHGVGFEVFGQSLGKVFRPDREINSFVVGGGLNYYPVRGLRLFTQAGAQIGLNGDVQTIGRAGLGFRFMFFNVGMQPFFYMQQTSKGNEGYTLAFRFEY
jgi:hypothetical protein